MRRLTFLVAAVLVAGCYAPAGSLTPSSVATETPMATLFASDLPSVTPSAVPPPTPRPSASRESQAPAATSWLARVRVAAVPVRAAPGVDQPVETVGPGAGPTDPSTVVQMSLNEDAWVIGEREVKGETWYQVATSGSVYWIPAGPAVNPTVAPFDLTECPSSPADTWTTLIDHPMQALACFGDRPLTLNVYWLTIEQQYLPYPCQERHWINCYEYVSLVGDGRSRVPPAGQQVAPELQISLAPELTNPLRGQWVALTGHLDDPRSQDCPRTLGYLEDPGAMAWATLACGTRFVADSVVAATKP